MDPQLLHEFQRVLLEECQYVLDEWQSLTEALDALAALEGERVNPAQEPEQSKEVWAGRAEATRHKNRAIQNLLGSSAIVSKLLFGSGRKQDAQGLARQPLRDSLGVTDSSPFKRDPLVRNRFEHIDEYLDDWWKASSTHNMASGVSPASLGEGQFDEKDQFRLFDPETGEASFWGETVNLGEIVGEVERLMPALREFY